VIAPEPTLVLLDERKGRQAARELVLRVAGTLGVILLPGA
jgi:predicted nucleic acid-binding protein